MCVEAVAVFFQQEELKILQVLKMFMNVLESQQSKWKFM